MGMMMNTTMISIVAASALSCAIATTARADCVQEPRKVSLEAKSEVLLKSYKCRLGQNAGAAEIRMEFYRLSDTAAGLIVAGGTTNNLRKAIGSPKAIRNDVWGAYADLIERFGSTEEIRGRRSEAGTRLMIDPSQRASSESNDSGQVDVDDVIGVRKYRHILLSGDSSGDYPAVDEITTLRKKILPNNLNYYYSSGGNCANDTSNFVCAKFHGNDVEMNFWRPMRLADVTNYAANIESYNTQLMKIRKDRVAAKSDIMRGGTPRYLQLMAHVAGEAWPDDLVILAGSRETQTCGDNTTKDIPGLDGWTFRYSAREISLDVVLLENVSVQPVVIDALVGHRIENTGLRTIASKSDASHGSAPLDKLSENLAPGERILVPTRIAFSANSLQKDEFGEYEKSKEEMHKLLGARGFKGNVDSYDRVLQFKDYAYGPELSINGVIVNSARVELDKRRAANSIDLTVTAEIGSCPYLLSWDDNDHEWVDHGKVLHKAPARDREYTEARIFEGLRTRFRVEEREPEIAHLNGATLVVKLDNGEELKLAPFDVRLAEQSRADLELLWGEGVEINFAPPDNIHGKRVTESRLEITGYYERYSNLQAEQASGGRSYGQMSRKCDFDRTADRENISNLACMRPVQIISPGLISVAPSEEVRN
jgi:hypothetical protein